MRATVALVRAFLPALLVLLAPFARAADTVGSVKAAQQKNPAPPPPRPASALYMFEPDEEYPRRFVDRPYTLSRNMSELRLDFHYQESQWQFTDRGKKVETPDKRTNMVGFLQAQYGYEYYLNILFRLPYIMKEVEDVNGPNKGDTFSGSGLGDLEIEVIYQLQNTGRFFIAPTLGLKLPGSENTGTEGQNLSTGSGTLDFYLKVPFKKAWRHWALGGMAGYRFFGQDDISDFKYGNRLDIQASALANLGDYIALGGELIFYTLGSSGLASVSRPGEDTLDDSFYGVGPRVMINPTPMFDIVINGVIPIHGVNADMYTTDVNASLALRF